MFKINETLGDKQEFTVVVKYCHQESRVVMEQFSDWLLGSPSNMPVARFSVPTELAVYGTTIGLTLQLGQWLYGDWNIVISVPQCSS